MLLPAKCFLCGGNDPACTRCGGTGTIAVGVDLSGPLWTRKCPDCGWTNGMYLPQAGYWQPKEGQPVHETYESEPDRSGRYSDFCMTCRDPIGRHKRGHMIWTRLS